MKLVIIYKILLIYLSAIILGIIVGIFGSAFQTAITSLEKNIPLFIASCTHNKIQIIILSVFLTILFASIAFLLLKIAPEATGSGVQEIEGALLHKRIIRWRKVLPVKFFGGILVISNHFVVGREGPMIHMGGILGKILANFFKLPLKKQDCFIAAGAAAGLAAAFNAPLAGAIFILEEMRSHFKFSFFNFNIVLLTTTFATITIRGTLGNIPAIVMPVYPSPNNKILIFFFSFGILVGLIAWIYNNSLMFGLKITKKFNSKQKYLYLSFISAVIGILTVIYPVVTGGGYEIIHQDFTLLYSFKMLIFILLIRFILNLLSYTTGLPGGIFAPLLALGSLIGVIWCHILQLFWSSFLFHPGIFAVVGMGSLFSACISAPVTGIVLIVEMTQNYNLILPLMLSSISANIIMQLLENRPIYQQLLAFALENSKKTVN